MMIFVFMHKLTLAIFSTLEERPEISEQCADCCYFFLYLAAVPFANYYWLLTSYLRVFLKDLCTYATLIVLQSQ